MHPSLILQNLLLLFILLLLLLLILLLFLVLLLIIPLLLDRPPCPDVMCTVRRWCSTTLTEAKETLNYVP